MKITMRGQNDGDQDAVSAAAATQFDPKDDFTRQEFKDEADINVMLSRFGLVNGNLRTPLYGEVDYTIDLQLAFEAVADANRVYDSLPQELKTELKLRDTASMLAAMTDGSLKRGLEEAKKREAQMSDEERFKADRAYRARHIRANQEEQERKKFADWQASQKVDEQPE